MIAYGDFLAELLYLGNDQALLNRFDPTCTEHWNHWTTTSSDLGTTLTSLPAGVALETPNTLLGVQFGTTEGGTTAQVVRYDITTQSNTVVVNEPWLDSISFAAGSVLME